METAPDTGRLALNTLAQDKGSHEPVTRGDLAILAGPLERLVEKDSQAQGAKNFGRVFVGSLLGVACSLSIYAIDMAMEARATQEEAHRAGELAERNAEGLTRLERDTRSRLDPVVVSLTRIETQLTGVLRALEERPQR